VTDTPSPRSAGPSRPLPRGETGNGLRPPILSRVLVGVAFLALPLLAIVWTMRETICRSDGLIIVQVGEARYSVPAWMDPYPIGQISEVSVFGFNTRPAPDRSKFGGSTPSIKRMSSLSPSYRPVGAPINWRSVKAVSYEARQVSKDGNRASIFFTLHFVSGPPRRLEAKCQYGKHVLPGLTGKEYVERCTTIVPLGGGNGLETNVNPGESPSVLGRELLRTLQAVERMRFGDGGADRKLLHAC
jgi:hypothetical protein